MEHEIKAIFLDSGNTMRFIVEDAAYQEHSRQQLLQLIGAKESLEALFIRLEERYRAFKVMARGTLLQPSETELWTRWMLPEESTDKIAPLASQLTLLWHDRKGRRVPRPDAKQTVIELHRRGYILGIIANSISEIEIPNWLEADGLTQYFKAVILSSQFGRRKPDLHIYIESAYAADVKPENCAYVGNDPKQDIKGAKQAGFEKVILLLEHAKLVPEPADGIYRPDAIIHQCSDLLKIFPAR
jgi:putative hydrolase of the HAD superfamily